MVETLDISANFLMSKCLGMMVENFLLVDQLLLEGGRDSGGWLKGDKVDFYWKWFIKVGKI